MKKNNTRGMLIFVILLVLYVMTMVLVPFSKGVVFSLSLIFTMASFVIGGYAVYKAFVQNKNTKSRFYGFPVAKIGVFYCITQIVVSLIMAACGAVVSWKIVLLIYLFVAGISCIGLISAEVAEEMIQEQDNKLKKDVARMRSLQSKVRQLAMISDELEGAEKVKTFAEEMTYSDPVSNEATAEMEQELEKVIEALQEAITNEDCDTIKMLCKKGLVYLAERNRLCKLNKS